MIPLRFTDGEEGHVVALDGEILEIRASGSHPPGQPVEVVLDLSGGALSLKAKSRGSRRIDDETFEVRLRLVELRKRERARIDAALANA